MTNKQQDLFIRSTIKKMISSITPLDREEEEHIHFVKNWLASGAEIYRRMKPDDPNIHLVAYFAVIDPMSNAILLAHHKKAGLWLPPGGHVEVNEHPQQTVRREVKEELGIEAHFLFQDPLFLTVTKTVGNVAPHIDVSIWFILKASKSDCLQFDEQEFHGICWYPWKDIPFEFSDPHMQRFINKAIKKLVNWNSYEASALQYTQNTALLYSYDHAQKFLNMLPNQVKMIDIGCGPGRDAKNFSEMGIEVVGIDFSSKMIEIAKQTAPKGSFYVMDIESLDFPLETFDGAWANCSLLHIPKKNIPFVLAKIYSLLKQEGILYLSVKEGDDEALEPDARYGGLEKFWSYFQEEEVANLLSQAGFKIVEKHISQKVDKYHTHPQIGIFAKKLSAQSGRV